MIWGVWVIFFSSQVCLVLCLVCFYFFMAFTRANQFGICMYRKAGWLVVVLLVGVVVKERAN